MKKLRITLRWRITLIAILITIISSLAIVVAINIDVSRRVPTIAQGVTSIEEQSNGVIASGGTVSFTEPQELGYIQGYIEIQAQLDNTVSGIYTTSIIVFIIIIIISGVSTYFITGKALKPVKDLNESIRDINENNLLVNLDVKGPKDEIKELTVSFNQMMSKLDNAFTSQKRFNSSVAHELKTPLAVMKTNIDVLNDGEFKTIDEYKDTLEIVEKSVVKMNSMIETLLDMVRQENASLDDEVFIDEIIENVIEDLDVIAKNNVINLQCNISNKGKSIKGNEVLLYRAIYNIVENAIKYNISNGEVIVAYKENKKNIEITVEDTGLGISEEEVKNIFEPFYRGGKEKSTNGIGLGLSLVKSAINLHGGEIKVSSQLGKGSTFIIDLPIN